MKLHFVRKYFGANHWKMFTRTIRPRGQLLSSLGDFPDSILVTGCQRSGTTLVTRLLVQSPEVNDIWVSNDDEYDAAMILSGNRDVDHQGRFCFQTTYLNDAYKEYIENINLPFKIIWVVRNPLSVVNSMLYNWKQFALNDTYKQCGEEYFFDSSRNRGFFTKYILGPSSIEKACFAYLGKQKQLLELVEYFSGDRLLVVNYESLTMEPESNAQKLFNFTEVNYNSEYSKLINPAGSSKKAVKNMKIIEDICMDTYEQVKELAII